MIPQAIISFMNGTLMNFPYCLLLMVKALFIQELRFFHEVLGL